MAATLATDIMMADARLRNSAMTDERTIDLITEIWTPPTFSAGKVPQVIPGKSNDRGIESDFPLDQIVIDRK